MHDNEKIVLVYIGNELIIRRMRKKLESEGIFSVIKDGFQSGLSAGFVGGVPSAIELYVLESDFKEAIEIINAISGD